MKKITVTLIILVSVALNVFLLIHNYRFKAAVNVNNQNTAVSKNTISVVDTIYGKKYVVDVDTVTGYAKIIGLRPFETVEEDSIE